ncbi:unnamed protein product [Heligmosomoides polygyrus]|uniref:Transposase n=1 Tax=Heligmosomoides polygyrus TaxID=6339 RepID=A0A183G3M2_HELPZ|nr:unnamed protein product [Heligmosomoides polygyrus]
MLQALHYRVTPHTEENAEYTYLMQANMPETLDPSSCLESLRWWRENYSDALMIHNTRGYLKTHEVDRILQEQQGRQSAKTAPTTQTPQSGLLLHSAQWNPRRLLSCQVPSCSFHDLSRQSRRGPMDATNHNIADNDEQDPRHHNSGVKRPALRRSRETRDEEQHGSANRAPQRKLSIDGQFHQLKKTAQDQADDSYQHQHRKACVRSPAHINDRRHRQLTYIRRCRSR